MTICPKCGGLIAYHPETFAGKPCLCIGGDSTLGLMGKDRLTQPPMHIFQKHTDQEYEALAKLIRVIAYQRLPIGDTVFDHLPLHYQKQVYDIGLGKSPTDIKESA